MSESKIAQEVARRRTFAIISHPDAGKTTLTEKLLLFSGAIHIAGTVKARKTARHATSDWMEIEKQRGISVASSVMQMEYRGCVINLLDTPGHQDFSEDTYRVLTAVDAALMVIDAGKGIEPQTLRLLQGLPRAQHADHDLHQQDGPRRAPAARAARRDRVGRSAWPPVPFTWPIGMGKQFKGVLDVRTEAGPRASASESSDRTRSISSKKPRREVGAWCAARAHALRPRGLPRRQADAGVLRLGAERLRRAGSARRAGRPRAGAAQPRRRSSASWSRPRRSFTGVVFKIQANMDPGHRDRIAFVRVCSGRFERGMRLVNCRSGKDVKTSAVVSFLSQRRDIVDEAYAGDIIGIPNRGTLHLGDTPDRGRDAAVPRPAVLRPGGVPPGRARHRDEDQAAARRPRAARRGGRDPDLPSAATAARRSSARWASSSSRWWCTASRTSTARKCACCRCRSTARAGSPAIPTELERLSNAYPHLMARDAAGVLAFFAPTRAELEVRQERFDKVRFHTQREYSGLEEAAAQA